MPAFLPCYGTRAQIDARPVANGQFLVATDTGEVFLDVSGRRIQLSGSSGGGTPSDGDDEEDYSLLTSWSIASAALQMSLSVPGGGPGNGVTNTPIVILDEIQDDLLTGFAVASAAVFPSGSVSGGGPGNGILNIPAVVLSCDEDDLTTSYSIMEAQ